MNLTPKHATAALVLTIALLGVTSLAVANDVGPLGPSVDVQDTTSGDNTTVVTPGGTTYIDAALNTTQTANKKFTSPAFNVTLPGGWDIDPISSSSGSSFADKGNTGEWLWLNNRSRSNITYEVNVPGGTASGTYTIDTLGAAINATTDNRVTDTTTTTITVSQRPTASFTISPNPADTGQTVTFDASGSSDPDGAISSYNWSFGDSTVANETGDTTTHVYSDNGTYSVTLTVTGDAGLEDSVTQTVTVNNRPPVADINANRSLSVEVGDAIQFDNGTSSDPDGWVAGNSWEFGDGDTATGTPVTKAYSAPGTYQVNLTVTDDDGATNTTNVTVTVAQAPVPDFTISPNPADTGQTVSFDASSTTDDGTIQSYNWSFGDGTTANNTGTTTTNTYSNDGSYTVTLTVTDDDGLTNSTSKTVTVNNRPPVVDIASNKSSPITVTVGETIQFDNGTSSDPDGWVAGNSWEFGDGDTATGTPVTKAYSAPGTYQVNLTVTDDDGATNTTNVTVTVQQAPTASFTVTQPSAAPTVNESLSYDASGSSDADGTIQSYNWSFGDGTTANNTGTTTTNTYGSNASFSVTLTVTDDDGLTDTATQTVNTLDCRPLAIADYDTADQQINLVEVQFAVAWYQTGSVVSGSGEVMGTTTPPFPSNNALTEIQGRINDWQTSTTVSC